MGHLSSARTKDRTTARTSTLVLPLVLSVALVLCTSCIKNEDHELKAVEEEMERASMSAYDLHTFVTDSGMFKYEFITPELQQYDNTDEPYTDFPGGLTFKMYDDQGRNVKSRVRCNKARYYKKQNLWELNNDVEALTEKGDVLNTEQMFWDVTEHRIYSEKFVKITTKGQLITGRGFESDDRMSKYEIKHPGGEIDVER